MSLKLASSHTANGTTKNQKQKLCIEKSKRYASGAANEQKQQTIYFLALNGSGNDRGAP